MPQVELHIFYIRLQIFFTLLHTLLQLLVVCLPAAKAPELNQKCCSRMLCFDVEHSIKIYDLPNSTANVRMHKNVDMKVPVLNSVYEQEHEQAMTHGMREIEAHSQTAQHPSGQKEDGRNIMAKSSFG